MAMSCALASQWSLLIENWLEAGKSHVRSGGSLTEYAHQTCPSPGCALLSQTMLIMTRKILGFWHAISVRVQLYCISPVGGSAWLVYASEHRYQSRQCDNCASIGCLDKLLPIINSDTIICLSAIYCGKFERTMDIGGVAEKVYPLAKWVEIILLGVDRCVVIWAE
eukprot:scaffold157998_cov66-Cyclotella_meneghiniana.AAC.1